MVRQSKAHWAPVVAWGVGLAVCLLLPAASGQDEGTGGEDEAWKAERTKLEEVIAQRIKEEVDKNVKRQDIATKLGMAWPVLKPPKTKEQVEADVEKQIDDLAAEHLPEARRKEFETEAAEKYRMYEVGEDVSFGIRGGLGPHAVIKGRLLESTQMRIRVGTRTVLRTDIEPEVQARFWEDSNEEFRKKYIRVQNTLYDAKISAFKDGKRQTMLPEALRAARYLHAQNKPQQEALRVALGLPEPTRKEERKLAEWFAEHDILELVYSKQRAAFEAEVKPKITDQVFMSNGYELVEDTINNTREWMPKQQALSFRERLKELIEKKKQEELEAGAEDADPWGAAPGAAGAQGQPGPGAEPGMMGPGGQPGMMGPGGQPGMMGPGGQPGMMGPGGQPGMMGPGGQPGMMGPGMPGMMGPGGQPGAGGGKPAAGKPADGGKNPFDENQ